MIHKKVLQSCNSWRGILDTLQGGWGKWKCVEILLSLLFLSETQSTWFFSCGWEEATKERAAYVWNSHLGWGSGMD